MTPLPADIQAALDLLEPQMRKAFIDAIAQVQSAAQLQTIIGHLESGDIESAVKALRLDKSFFAPLDRAISEAQYQGALLTLLGLPKIKDPFPVGAWSLALMADTHVPKAG